MIRPDIWGICDGPREGRKVLRAGVEVLSLLLTALSLRGDLGARQDGLAAQVFATTRVDGSSAGTLPSSRRLIWSAWLKTLLTSLAQTEPSVVPILSVSFNKGQDDLLALIQRQITWGEYMRRMRDRATETQAAVRDAEAQIVAELREENQAELEQRQRAAEALASWAQSQELINAANRPVITNCNAFAQHRQLR